MTLRFYLLIFFLCLLCISPSQAAPAATSPYRVVIREVNSTDFPNIKVSFQVFLQDVNATAWDWTNPPSGVFIEEYVIPRVGDPQGESIDPADIEPVEICEEQPVIMSVAIDVSGSVSGVLGDIKTGVTNLFNHMKQYGDLNPSKKKDFGSVFAFASGTSFRYPAADAAVTDLFSDELDDLEDVVKEIPAGGASPIWISMEEELDRTLAFKPDETDYKRVLATLTDGQNNQANDALPRLLKKAQLGGAQLFNLGYGAPNAPDLQRIADSSGGVFIPGADDDISKTLLNLLNSVRTTYCVKYRSPFGDKVNETAATTIKTGGTWDTAFYPLPFLIPEDSQDVKLFFPVTAWTYEAISGGDPSQLPEVKAKMYLRDNQPDPQAWEPPSTDHPDRLFKDFEISQKEWIHVTDPLDPLKSRIGFEIPVPVEVLSVPTDFVDLEQATSSDQLISSVQHYLVTATLVYPPDPSGNATVRAGRQYPSSTRLSIQDRTPPDLFLRLRRQASEVLQFQLREGPDINVDTGLVARWALTKEAALARGTGDKRAELEFQWVNPDQEVVQGLVSNQFWSQVEEFGTSPEKPGPDHPDVFLTGIHIPELLRLSIEVLARDNFALAGDSTNPVDRDVWAADQLGVQTKKPLHAEFDSNREEAQPGELRTPFLPIKPRSELENRRNLAGVAWWIQSNYDESGLVDNATRFESLPTMRFRISDEEILKHLQEAGSPPPPANEPLRWLMVRAQDGQGNTTLVQLPLYVGDMHFQPRLLDWKRKRSRRHE
jgi:hypothetical protein